jgi:hypothetical protein
VQLLQPLLMLYLLLHTPWLFFGNTKSNIMGLLLHFFLGWGLTYKAETARNPIELGEPLPCSLTAPAATPSHTGPGGQEEAQESHPISHEHHHSNLVDS